MADLKACLPSGREDTVAQEDMPGTTTTATIVTSAMTRPTVMEKTIATTTIVTSAMARPKVMENTISKESKKHEEWPEEDSDKEMELEMMKLLIEIETEKVELRRIEDDQNFLQEVAIIEKKRKAVINQKED